MTHNDSAVFNSDLWMVVVVSEGIVLVRTAAVSHAVIAGRSSEEKSAAILEMESQPIKFLLTKWPWNLIPGF